MIYIQKSAGSTSRTMANHLINAVWPLDSSGPNTQTSKKATVVRNDAHSTNLTHHAL